ncbi:MAG: hypothetical protein IKU46_04215 [Peptococcaceae bacterium]|nr:hypothetical protein [Peptococcaceae bacterium]
MENQTGQQMMPGSLNDLKLLVQQFEMFLPEDKRNVIYNTIAQIEAAGGIHDEAQGQKILADLMQSLGLGGLQK